MVSRASLTSWAILDSPSGHFDAAPGSCRGRGVLLGSRRGHIRARLRPSWNHLEAMGPPRHPVWVVWGSSAFPRKLSLRLSLIAPAALRMLFGSRLICRAFGGNVSGKLHCDAFCNRRGEACFGGSASDSGRLLRRRADLEEGGGGRGGHPISTQLNPFGAGCARRCAGGISRT